MVLIVKLESDATCGLSNLHVNVLVMWHTNWKQEMVWRLKSIPYTVATDCMYM